ncbi:hypothetical protein QBC36DRAFT_359397 [Triangularia setosa]|uniref:Ankyrin repeat protein n=1 Tax=Triangularia setosa TaxID=2587417 RepID=A0AAN6W1R8_9PEZI|nr:hypothetical protein QBC36DRAFT_359397 [Podospora setosa]
MFSASPALSPTMSPPMTPYPLPLSSTSPPSDVKASLCRTVSTMYQPALSFSEKESAWAKHLMSEHCTNKGRKSKGEFSYKDANAILASIADGKVLNATPALVKALQTNFKANASIERRKSTNLFKVMTGRDQEDIRSNVLERAVQNCSYDIVYSLAMGADQDALDRALPFAITQNDTAKVFVLISSGANAAPLCAQFLHAVDNGPDDMLPLLLQEIKGACGDCRHKGLVRASASGNLLKVQILIDANADTTYDDAAALKVAILGHHEDIAVAIASTAKMASIPLHLDTMVGEAFAAGQDRTLSACLQSGARGPVTDKVLLEAVKQRRSLELVRTLAVMGGRPSKSIISATIDTLASLRVIPIIHNMVNALLPAGLEGDPVNTLLAISLHGDTLEGEPLARSSLVQLLVQRGNADVNFNGGQPLVLAATKGWLGILSVLLSSPTSLQSLQAAVAASMGIADTKVRLGIIERLLHAAGLNRQLLEVSIFQSACRSFDLSLIELLPHSGRSSEEVLAGFRAALSNPRWLKPSGLPTVRALLHLGVSGSDVSQAFCHAAKSYERDAFELFAAYVDFRTVIETLQVVIQASKDWLAPNNKYLWLVHDLLEWGGRGSEQANHTFLIAIEEYLLNRSSDALVETILSVGHADVNFQSGKALKLAVWTENLDVFRMLLSRGVTMKTIEDVFFEAMIASVSEDTALLFIDILTSADGLSCVKGFKKVIPQLRAPVRDCLMAHPGSIKLIKRLIKLGVNFDVEEPTILYGNKCGPELCTTLLWSLIPPPQGRRPIEPGVIRALIEAKVNVNFVAPNSKATALILAANFGHTDTVNHLIEAGANTRVRDYLNFSALFYASRNGHLNAVRSLLKSPYKPNDGSLHEAARNLHSKICTVLIGSCNFGANYPSLDHQGRTPLQEMAYCCDGTRNQVDMEDTLLALKKGGLELFKFSQNFGWKNAMLLALENPRPFSVTQALLDILWQLDHMSLFADNVPQKIHSPRSEKEAQPNRALEQMLRDKGAEDRYWSGSASDQPFGAIGHPEPLAKEIKRLEKIQRDHNDQLRREGEAQHQKIFFEQARHEQRLAQDGQTTIQKVQNSTILHENKLHQEAEVTLQQHQAMEEKNHISHRGRVLANQDKAALVAVDNNGLAQKHHINEHHQQVMDYQKRTDWQKVAALQAVDQQKLLGQKAQEMQKLKALEATDKHKLNYLHKTDKEKREHTKKTGEQQVTLKKSLAKLASKEDQRKLDFQYNMNEENLDFQHNQAQIKPFQQMAQNHIAGQASPPQGKVVKKQGPGGYIEN